MVLRSTPVAPRHRVQLLALCGGGERGLAHLPGRPPGVVRSCRPGTVDRLTGAVRPGGWRAEHGWAAAAQLHRGLADRRARSHPAGRGHVPAGWRRRWCSARPSPSASSTCAGQRAPGLTSSDGGPVGGRCLVTPDDPLWIDVWVPAGDPLWRGGREPGLLAGSERTWVEALGRLGGRGLAVAHVRTARRSGAAGVVCFGGVSTGEVVAADGRKVVVWPSGAARAGAWFHGACPVMWDPSRSSTCCRWQTASGNGWHPSWRPPPWGWPKCSAARRTVCRGGAEAAAAFIDALP